MLISENYTNGYGIPLDNSINDGRGRRYENTLKLSYYSIPVRTFRRVLLFMLFWAEFLANLNPLLVKYCIIASHERNSKRCLSASIR